MATLDPSVQVAIIAAGSAIITSAIGIVSAKLANDARKHAEKANYQVSNTHETNLRDDVDAIHEDVRTVLRIATSTQENVNGLASDLRSLEGRFEEHIKEAS